ncbi:MAG: beta-galactosidase [Tannerella sp.]|jgi:beta-galactosidase|nr:beta-galactosidase [Tannerella sp.]
MIKKVIYLSLWLMPLCAVAIQAQDRHTFEIRDGEFMYDDRPVRIISGEMHYARIPHQYWRHRLQMLKALGLNAVATYVFWNFHETEPDVWDFSGDRNLAEYIRIAGEEGLMVILRPGPYVCAEWEFGGYPAWLQNIDGMELRRDNEAFLKRTRLYINRLYEEVGSLLITRGGPVIMVQAENEFGSYVSQRKDIPLEEHRRYNARIKTQLDEAGFDVPFFTSDGSWLFEGGSTPGALPTANGEDDVENLKKVVREYHGGKGPYMVAEFYPGWLAHWAEPHPRVDASQVAQQTETYLQNGVSFNFYMVHGGTNFAFTSGANYDRQHDIQPDLTSYDYDAPVSEAGWVTPKYDSIRRVIARYADHPLPEPPAANPVIGIPHIRLDRIAPLDALETDVTHAVAPMTFEQLGQYFGYVMYVRKFNQPASGTLEITGLRDYALVYVDTEKAGELNRRFNRYSMDIDIPFNSELRLLVENMGRINYGAQIVENTKGIISPVLIDGKPVTGNWEMRRIPMDKAPDFGRIAGRTFDNTPTAAAALAGKPVIYRGTFTLQETGDTFLDMSTWGKGIVFVNGRNIGRYWKTGPQKTLYIPGVWLAGGVNEIVIFEQQNDRPQTSVSAVKVPVLHDLTAE